MKAIFTKTSVLFFYYLLVVQIINKNFVFLLLLSIHLLSVSYDYRKKKKPPTSIEFVAILANQRNTSKLSKLIFSTTFVFDFLVNHLITNNQFKFENFGKFCPSYVGRTFGMLSVRDRFGRGGFNHIRCAYVCLGQTLIFRV